MLTVRLKAFHQVINTYLARNTNPLLDLSAAPDLNGLKKHCVT